VRLALIVKRGRCRKVAAQDDMEIFYRTIEAVWGGFDDQVAAAIAIEVAGGSCTQGIRNGTDR